MTFYLGTKGELEFLELEIGEEFLGKRLNKLSSSDNERFDKRCSNLGR